MQPEPKQEVAGSLCDEPANSDGRKVANTDLSRITGVGKQTTPSGLSDVLVLSSKNGLVSGPSGKEP